MKLLLKHGADVNAKGGRYGSALHRAAGGYGRPSPELVKLLLENGAHVNVQGGELGNALQAAAAGPQNTSPEPRHDPYQWTPQEEAQNLEKSEAIVKLLLKHGADVNARGGKYGSALCAAVNSGSLEITPQSWS